jgi:hypothetical protein
MIINGIMIHTTVKNDEINDENEENEKQNISKQACKLIMIKENNDENHIIMGCVLFSISFAVSSIQRHFSSEVYYLP